MTAQAGDPERLNADLARAYQRLADLSRELADEQALTRRLRAVIALLPYNAVRRVRPRPTPDQPPTSPRPPLWAGTGRRAHVPASRRRNP